MTENEKLRALLAEWRKSLGDPCGVSDCYFEPCLLAARIDDALAEPVGNDFKRGAEAMREAAAKFVRKTGWDMNHQVAGTIGALPLPEDK